MGVCISKPVIQINNKKLTQKEFKQLKTSKDVMHVAGYSVEDSTTLRLLYPKYTAYVNACDTFLIPDGIQYNSHTIYIRKLYGRS